MCYIIKRFILYHKSKKNINEIIFSSTQIFIAATLLSLKLKFI